VFCTILSTQWEFLSSRSCAYQLSFLLENSAPSQKIQLHSWNWQDNWTTNRGSIPGKNKGFFSPSKWLDRFLDSSMFLINGQREYLRASGACSCLLTSIYAQIKNEWSYASIACLLGNYSDNVTLRYSLEHSSWVGIAQPRNSLRPGRSGNPIPVAAVFSARFQTGPGSHSASCTIRNGCLSGG
jgi:hypothetical protein